MTKELLSYLKFGNRFYAVEQTHLNGEDKYYGISLKKNRKQIDVASSFQVDQTDNLKTHIPKGKPIILIINTNSVLTKKIESKNNDILKLVLVGFPNIKVEDFYYEVINQGESHFISICRKSYVDNLLKKYALKHISIIDFTLGNLACASVAPFIDSPNMHSTNAIISLENKLITDITPKNIESVSTYYINGLNIKNNLLLSFAAALTLVIKKNSQSNFVDTKEELNNIFKQKQFASQFLKIGLSTLFIILLINFLFFNHYFNEVNSLRENVIVLDASKNRMVSLNEKVQKTEKMVNDILKSSGSKSSFYVNTIINNLPKSILLQEFNYQPLLKKIKEEKAIESLKNTIIISGKTNKSILFSQWISQIETNNWVTSVKIINFEDLSKSSSKFTIKIDITDDTKN